MDIKQSDTKMSFDLKQDMQGRKEAEVRVGKVIDEKLYALRLELAKEKKLREESADKNEQTFGGQIDEIAKAIDEENRERDESN